MGSSRSTPAPSADRALPLYVWRIGDDHARRCTGARLLHLGIAQPFHRHANVGAHPIVLDPRADTPLCGTDRATAEGRGILAIDCSWNAFHRRNAFPPEVQAWVGRNPRRRRLPWLVATNPQHYGHLGELNTAEALGAALYLVGSAALARRVLEPFPGGEAFWSVNGRLLRVYEQAADASGVVAAERAAL